MHEPVETPFPDERDHCEYQVATAFHFDVHGASATLTARIGPCGVLLDFVERPGGRRSSVRRRRRTSVDVHCSHGGLADRGGRWESGWCMVAGRPAALMSACDPFKTVRDAAVDLLGRQLEHLGGGPNDVSAMLRARPGFGGIDQVDVALRRIAAAALAALDPKLVRIARRVHPSMRWWLYEVAVAARRELGPPGERNVAQAVACIPGVLLLAFALDDPADPAAFEAVTRILRHVAGGTRRAPHLAADLVAVWMERRKDAGRVLRRRGRLRRAARRLSDPDDDPDRWLLPAGLGDEALRRSQQRLVLRASRLVDPLLLLVPAPPRWAPEDVPADPRACARWFAVVQGTRCHPAHEAVRALAPRRHGAWDPAFSGFVSAHALALWHRRRDTIAHRVAGVEVWAGTIGRRPCRASDPAKVLAEAEPFQRLVRSPWALEELVPGRCAARFPVPEAFSYAGGGLRVEPIRSAVELILEAGRMRNCLANYLERCSRGRYVVCRAVVKGRTWLLGFRRQGEAWALHQVGGRFNRSMPVEVLDALGPFFEAAGVIVPGRCEPPAPGPGGAERGRRQRPMSLAMRRLLGIEGRIGGLQYPRADDGFVWRVDRQLRQMRMFDEEEGPDGDGPMGDPFDDEA